MPDSNRIEDRLTAVETLLTHLQYDLEQFHDALVGQQRDLDALRRDLDKIRGHVERLETNPEDRDPNLEKPPHY